ncbi:MAG: hypothetical protein ACP5N2_06100 [Candidatus Nanoarchaeia archaeon]
MSKPSHSHLTVFVVGTLVITAFVLSLVFFGGENKDFITGKTVENLNSRSSLTGMATGQVTWLSCSDSEIPPTPYIKGTISVRYLNTSSGIETTVSRSDECKTSTSVTEYACKGKIPMSYTLNCPLGASCQNGVCAQGQMQDCTDPDGGKNYLTQGSATGMNPITGVPINLPDACVSDTDDLLEGYCLNNVPTYTRVTCPMGCDGSNGRCFQTMTCTESDNRKDFNLAGATTGVLTGIQSTQFDYCYNSTHVNEFFCLETNYPSYMSGAQYACPQGFCAYGRCGGTTPPTCTDSDNVDGSVKGTVTINGQNVYSDYCVKSGAAVREGTCGAQGKLVTQVINCEEGVTCEYGACGGIPHVCTDTDGGVNGFVQGSVSINGLNVHTDSCSAGVILEGSCGESNTLVTQSVSCSAGCDAGACLSSNYGDSFVVEGDIAKTFDGSIENTVSNQLTIQSEQTQTNQVSVSSLNRNTSAGSNGSGMMYANQVSAPSLIRNISGGGNGSGMMYAPNPGGNIPVACYDSDGLNKYTFGYVYGNNLSSSFNLTDYCYSSSIVMEQYCSIGKPVSGLYSCGVGYNCTGGRCLTNLTMQSGSQISEEEKEKIGAIATSAPTGSGAGPVASVGLACSCTTGSACPWSTCSSEGSSCECCIGNCPGAGCDLAGSGKCKESLVYIN